mgnify:CR=1 FL=1
MEKFLYFNQGSSTTGYSCSADQITSVEPETTGTTVMYVNRADGSVDRLTFTHDNTTTTTGHRCQDIAKEIVSAVNAGPHMNGMVDVVDLENSIFLGALSFVTALAVELDTYQDYVSVADTSYHALD